MGAREARAGKAFVEVVTRENLGPGLARGAAKLRGFSTLVASLGGAVSAAAGSIFGALAAALNSFSDTGDAIEKMAGRTGMATEAVSELGYAAGLSGTNMAELETGIKKMQQTIADARNGSKAATETLRQMGITIDMLKETPDAQLEVFADALAKIEDPALRTALAVDVFGRSGTQLIPLLSGGADGLKAMREEAARLGQTVSGETAARAADLNDALGRLWATVERLSFNLAAALAPAATTAANATAEIVGWMIQWIQENERTIKIVTAVVGAVAAAGAAITGLGLAGLVASGVLSGLAFLLGAVGSTAGFLGGVISAAFAAVLSPVGLVAAAVVGLGAAFLQFTSAGQELVEAVSSAFGGLGTTAAETWASVVAAFQKGDIQGILDALGQGLGQSLGIAGELIASLASAARSTWSLIATAVVDAAAVVRTAWSDTQSWMSEAWESLTSTASTVWSRIVQTVSAAAAALPGALQTAWDTITAAASSAAEALPEVLQSAWEAIKSGVTSVAAAIPGILSDAWSGLGDVAAAAAAVIPGKVQPAWLQLVAAAQTVLGKLSTLLFGTGEHTAAAFAGGLSLAQDAVAGVLGSLWSFIAGGASESARRLTGPIGDAVELVAQNWETILSAVQDFLGNIGPIMSGLGAMLLRPWDAVKGIVSAALNGLTAIWRAGVGALPGFLQPVVNAVAAVATVIFRPLVTAGAFMIDGIGTLFGGLASLVMTPFGTLLQAWGAAWTTMQSWVSAAFAGIPAAAQAAWDSLKAAAGSAGAFIAGAFHENLRLVQEAFSWIAQSAMAYLGSIAQGFTDLGHGIVSLFSELVTDAGAAWQGISAALAVGDFSVAWEIAWNSIQLIFWKSIAPIQTGWAEFTTGLATVMDGALLTLRQSFSNVTTWIAEQIFNLLGMLQSAVATLADFDPTGLAGELSAALTIDIDGAKKVLQDDRDRFNQQIADATSARDDARVKALTKAQEDVDRRIADLAKARDDLNTGTLDASDGKTLADKIGPALSALGRFDPSSFGLKGFDMNAIREQAEQGSSMVNKAIDPKGTFSAQAAVLLGLGGTNQKPEEETAKNTARALEKLDEQTRAIERIKGLQYTG